MKKLTSKRGETLIETMVALGVITVIISMLPIAIVTAARINKQAEDIPTICSQTRAAGTENAAAVTVTILDTTAGSQAAIINQGAVPYNANITGYSEDGFFYYAVD